MLFFDDISAQEKQHDKFFIVWALIGFQSDLCSMHNQILTSSVIPSLEDVFAQLLRISLHATNSNEIETFLLTVKTKNQ